MSGKYTQSGIKRLCIACNKIYLNFALHLGLPDAFCKNTGRFVNSRGGSSQ